MDFVFPSSLTVAQRTLLKDQYISAAQDVRDIFKDFTVHDETAEVDSVEIVARPGVLPASVLGRYEVASPILPTEQVRTISLSKIASRREVDTFGSSETLLPRMEKEMQDNLASFRLSMSKSWIQAAKGLADIKVQKNSSINPNIVQITADEDNVLRLDAIGGEDVRGNPLPIGVDDMIIAVSAHSTPNIGNMVGIAGGASIDSAILKGAAFCVMTSNEMGDFMRDNRQSLIGEINYQPFVYSGFSHLTQRLPIFMGYPLIMAGNYIGDGDPTTILDAAQDSIIIDNGDGTYDVERDIILATGESVARTRTPRRVSVGAENASTSIYNVVLEGKVGSVRTKGPSLVFLRVQRTIAAASAIKALQSGYFTMKPANVAATEKLERLQKQGHNLSDKRLEKLKRKADSTIKKGK